MPLRSAALFRPLALCCLALLAAVARAAGAPAGVPRSAEEPSDQIIVKWRATGAEAPAARLDELAHSLSSATGLRLARARALGGGLHVLRLDAVRQPAELNRLLATLRSNPLVQLAEPDGRVHAHAYTPNDPVFPGQWYLQTQQVAASQVVNAWDITHAGTSPATSPIVVAVVDTGVRFEHPDLLSAAAGGKLLPGYDFVAADALGVYATANDGDGWDADPSDPGDWISAADLANPVFAGRHCGGGPNNDQPTPSSWHGTRVSGMLAAITDNSVGIAGAGFNMRVLPVRVLGKCGGHDSDVIAAMYWAAGLSIPPALLAGVPPVNTTPAQILNLSLGSVGPCSTAYAQAVSDVTAHGVLIVVSAGNEGGQVDSPASCTGALGVAGLRQAGTKVGYSSLGPQIAIAAPAGNCINTAAGSPCLYTMDTTTNSGQQGPVASTYTDQYNSSVGTSFAAPLVSATAGLMLAVNPHLTPAKLIARLQESSTTFPTQSDTTPQPPACHVPADSKDLQTSECICTTAVCGAGMLNAGAAVSDALRPAAVAGVEGTVGVGQTLTVDGSASGPSQGRSIASYAWSVVSTAGGASTPAFANPAAATTTVLSPTSGSYTLRLTVTDSAGATDSADVTVNAATSGGGVSGTATPPSSGQGGGGRLGPELLGLALLAGWLVTWRRRMRRTRA